MHNRRGLKVDHIGYLCGWKTGYDCVLCSTECQFTTINKGAALQLVSAEQLGQGPVIHVADWSAGEAVITRCEAIAEANICTGPVRSG